MRNVLWYYYQIRCDEIKEKDDEIFIKKREEEYIFKELKMPIEILKQIVETLYFRQIPTFVIVLNKEQNISTKYNDREY
ncbi:MAG: hypothetical protein K2G03_04195, partial [Bacilli bacterium]|nr:hypothetical protein [Bacilli bacterium]